MLRTRQIADKHAAAPSAPQGGAELCPILRTAAPRQAPHLCRCAERRHSCLARMQVRKARTLYMCGETYRHAAALLVSEALRRDPGHEGALLEYVRIVLDRGHTADAIRILLRLLVNSRERTAVRQGPARLPSVSSLERRIGLVCTMQGSCRPEATLQMQPATCCGSQ